ncbi:vitamin B12 dependent-methionine synthase activation domain-containing protein [Saccharicrinis fermentans]|uniref:Vitamin B12 dependent methionine synthase n=1 Tax=Saccharicrinis fermentans DSM 9555 = JCM 21142 TaxID=869213 RepID=W7YAX2_9BACT|nr:vitamin B12 dependent-methionine synthase activation domain-containing protein [Saccharicrinis fermentans]GAF04758.1 vitamin B12 dependent methionine synthase [Saccharicrinis fermentans DSM 9555 = JCM 21142]
MESTKHFSFHMNELDILLEDVEELAHLGDDMPFYSLFLKEEIKRFNNIASVEGGYVIKKGGISGDSIEVENTLFQTGRDINRHFRNATYFAVFLCTAGSEISERSKELSSQGQLLEGYILDVLGSVIVEKAMDKIQETLKSQMEPKGLRISNRYSPGYCAWDVKEQRKLFSFFSDGFCHVKLSDTCLMHPIKTVSGMIGIGEKVKYHKHVCHACNSVNCLYRNVSHS